MSIHLLPSSAAFAKKIETDERKYIKTAYGMGYQWIGGEAR